jgi:hypothetical protein
MGKCSTSRDDGCINEARFWRKTADRIANVMRTSSCKKTLNLHEDPGLHFSTMNKIQAECAQKREGNLS